MNVMVWYENQPLPQDVEGERCTYPEGIQGALGHLFAGQPDMRVRTAVMQDAYQGFHPDDLRWADVLVYYSHKHWRDVEDVHVDALQERVLEGMGLVLLHSAHASKIFSRLMGTRTNLLNWHEDGEGQRVWIVNPAHEIVKGLDVQSFTIPEDETYCEYFHIPQPEEQVLLTTSESGDVFRSGCCWTRGKGKIFYFSAGHETYPVFYQKEVVQIILNAVRWANRGAGLNI